MNGPFSMAMLNNQRVGQIECGILWVLCSKRIWILRKNLPWGERYIFMLLPNEHIKPSINFWNGWEHRYLLLDVLMFSWIPVFNKKNIQHAPIWTNKSHIFCRYFAAEICLPFLSGESRAGSILKRSSTTNSIGLVRLNPRGLSKPLENSWCWKTICLY